MWARPEDSLYEQAETCRLILYICVHERKVFVRLTFYIYVYIYIYIYFQTNTNNKNIVYPSCSPQDVHYQEVAQLRKFHLRHIWI